MELALAVCDSPRASQIFGILASGRLLGERSALITSIRSKKRLSQKILQKSWPFLQLGQGMTVTGMNQKGMEGGFETNPTCGPNGRGWGWSIGVSCV